MTRDAALRAAARLMAHGSFHADLARRIAIPTESQNPDRAADLARYLTEELQPALAALGFVADIHANPAKPEAPFLVARYDEDPALPTVLIYGHGDVVRGQAGSWAAGRDPWALSPEGDRLYGRGTADNKGQHSIALAALGAVRMSRGRLGCNVRILIEMGEEIGSPGLRDFCRAQADLLRADLLLASDGPRLRPDKPTLFMGARGSFNFDLAVELRQGAHHSGNWGGLLANPAIILAHALSSMVGPTGEIRVPALRPPPIPPAVRSALAGLTVDGGADGPSIDPWWGEPGLTPAERVFGWNSCEILAMTAGRPEAPVNAIPASARAHCQLRFVVGSDPEGFLPAIRAYLDATGFERVSVTAARDAFFPATRLDPEHPWARWAIASVERTVGERPDVLPNLGGGLPNDCFADIIGMPTIWVPHSYAGCSQHAPDEHALISIQRQGLEIMAGLFWDLGELGKARPN